MDGGEVTRLARILWEYHHIKQELRKSDCILALGSHDLRVAEYAAGLHLQGWAPLLIFSGNLGNFTKDIWEEPEAEKFARIALRMGVPQDQILTETRSTNTGENLRFTRDLLQSRGLNPSTFIVVHKPNMLRRVYSTVEKIWPGMDYVVSAAELPLQAAPHDHMDRDWIINEIVGDLQRIMLYPERGFQIAQAVPLAVRQAYQRLIELGFDKHLMRD